MTCACCSTDGCNRCITIFRKRVRNVAGGTCDKNEVCTVNVNIPAAYSFPLTIKITGGVDDDLKVNGTLIEDNVYEYLGSGCNGGHCIGSAGGWPYGYTTTISSSPLTLTLVDNFGYNRLLDVTVCLDPDNEQGKNACPTVTDVSYEENSEGQWSIGTDACCVSPDCELGANNYIDPCRCNPYP